MADEKKSPSPEKQNTSSSQRGSDYRPDDTDYNLPQQTTSETYDELPEHVTHRSSGDSDVQESVYGKSIPRPGIGAIATAPLETMSASDFYKGTKMIQAVTSPASGAVSSVGFGIASQYSKRDFLYHIDHSEAAAALKAGGVDYVLGANAANSPLSASGLISQARDETRKYLEQHGIFLGKASDAKISQAIDSGRFGKRILTDKERAVLLENYNLSVADRMSDHGRDARGKTKSTGYQLAKRSFRGSDVLQGKGIAGGVTGVITGAGRSAYYAASRGVQAGRIMRNKRMAGKANRLKKRGEVRLGRGDTKRAKEIKDRAEKLREKIKTRKEVMAARLKRRTAFEGKARKFRSKSTVGKGVHVVSKTAALGARGAAKAMKLDKSKLYKRMSERLHARRIRKMALAKKHKITTVTGRRRFLRAWLPGFLKRPSVVIVLGLLFLILVGGVMGTISAFASWIPSWSDGDGDPDDAESSSNAEGMAIIVDTDEESPGFGVTAIIGLSGVSKAPAHTNSAPSRTAASKSYAQQAVNAMFRVYQKYSTGMYMDTSAGRVVSGTSTNAESAYALLVDAGFSPAAAAGIVGNMYAETGYMSADINPNVTEGNGEGVGLCQWSFGSKQDFLSFARAKNDPWPNTSVSTQIAFLVDTFNRPGHWNWASSYQARYFPASCNITKEEFKKATDAAFAAEVFCAKYEVPAYSAQNVQYRKNKAVEVYNAFSGKAYNVQAAEGGEVNNLEMLEKMNLIRVTWDGNLLDESAVRGGIEAFSPIYEFREAGEMTKYDNYTGVGQPYRPAVPEEEKKDPITVRYHFDGEIQTQLVYPEASVDQYLGDVSIAKEGYHLAGWQSASMGRISQPYPKLNAYRIRALGSSADLYPIWEKNGPKTVVNFVGETHEEEIRFPTDEEMCDTLRAALPASKTTIRYQYLKDGETVTTTDYSEVVSTHKELYKTILAAVTVMMENDIGFYNKALAIKLSETLMEYALTSGSGYRVDYQTVPLPGTAGTEYGVTWKKADGTMAEADGVRVVANVTVFSRANAEELLTKIDITAKWLNENKAEDDPTAEYTFGGWTEDSVDMVREYTALDDDDFMELFNLSYFPKASVSGTNANVLGWLNEICEAEGYDLSEKRINFLRCALEDHNKFKYSLGAGHGSQPPSATATHLDCSSFVCYELYRSGADSWHSWATPQIARAYHGSSHAKIRPGDILVMNPNPVAGGSDHTVIYAGWFTYNGTYAQWVVECCGGIGTRIANYRGYSWYAHVRAIDEVRNNPAACRALLEEMGEAGAAEGSISATYNGHPVGTGNCYTVTPHYHTWNWGYGPRRVFEAWKKQGSVYTTNVATIDGKYLIACTDTYGTVGDHITWYFDNGSSIETIMADTKSRSDPNWTQWGHIAGNIINVLEFETNQLIHPGTAGCIPQINNLRVVGWTNHGKLY